MSRGQFFSSKLLKGQFYADVRACCNNIQCCHHDYHNILRRCSSAERRPPTPYLNVSWVDRNRACRSPCGLRFYHIVLHLIWIIWEQKITILLLLSNHCSKLFILEMFILVTILKEYLASHIQRQKAFKRIPFAFINGKNRGFSHSYMLKSTAHTSSSVKISV